MGKAHRARVVEDKTRVAKVRVVEDKTKVAGIPVGKGTTGRDMIGKTRAVAKVKVIKVRVTKAKVTKAEARDRAVVRAEAMVAGMVEEDKNDEG